VEQYHQLHHIQVLRVSLSSLEVLEVANRQKLGHNIHWCEMHLQKLLPPLGIHFHFHSHSEGHNIHWCEVHLQKLAWHNNHTMC